MDRRTGASLTLLGLTESWSASTLTDLGWWDEDGPRAGAEPIMWALARSPTRTPRCAALERLVEAVPDRAALDAALRTDVRLRGRLTRVCSAAPRR